MMIGTQIRSILTTFNPDYMHFFGELCVLNNVIKSKSHTLIAVEYTMGNNRRIDLKFISNTTQEEILLEVMNIKLNGDKLNNHEEIKRYLTQKIIDKINLKTNNKPSSQNFKIIPVLWSQETNDLWKVCEFYKNGPGINITNIIEPFCYLCRKNSDTGGYDYKFEKASALFD